MATDQATPTTPPATSAPGATPPPNYLPSGEPPLFFRRFGVVATTLVAGTILYGFLMTALDGRWETKAHAQEVATAHAASLSAAKANCEQNLRTAVDQNRAEIAAVRERLIRLEVSSDYQAELLRNIARRLDVPTPPQPPNAHAPLLSPAPPAPASSVPIP